jgi:hypothetical protein
LGELDESLEICPSFLMPSVSYVVRVEQQFDCREVSFAPIHGFWLAGSNRVVSAAVKRVDALPVGFFAWGWHGRAED